jgi:hypothetical protein
MTPNVPLAPPSFFGTALADFTIRAGHAFRHALVQWILWSRFSGVQ